MRNYSGKFQSLDAFAKNCKCFKIKRHYRNRAKSTIVSCDKFDDLCRVEKNSLIKISIAFCSVYWLICVINFIVLIHIINIFIEFGSPPQNNFHAVASATDAVTLNPKTLVIFFCCTFKSDIFFLLIYITM